MTPIRRVIGASVGLLVLCASACSGGSSKPALPTLPTAAFAPATTAFATTTSPPSTTTTTPVATTTTPPLRVVDLADCPRDNPNNALTRLNAGPSDVATDLVPIDALNVRVCKYGPVGKAPRLLGISWLALSVARTFTADTNNLPTTGPGVTCTGPTQSATSFFLTFAVDTQTTNLYAGGCPIIVSNGTLTAPASAEWYSELAQYTNHASVTPKAP
jgi:hypothetical protein